MDRRERTVIEIGFNARQRRDEPLVADGEADAPAGHRVGLRQRCKLHRDIHRARHLQDRRRRLVAEIDFRIGDIGKQDEVVLPRVVHHFLVEIEARHDRGRVGRIAQHQRERLWNAVPDGLVHRDEKIVIHARRDVAHGRAGYDEAEFVDRIGGIGHEDHVARRGDGLRHIGKAFLRAKRRHNLRVGIELHAETPLVIRRLRAPEPRNAARCRVAVGLRLGDRLHQLFDDVLGRGQIRISHAEVDDVFTARSGRGLELIHLLEDIGRQAFDAVKFFSHDLSAFQMRKGLSLRRSGPFTYNA